MAQVVVSAPGKVLITGGYVVMERPNAGIVLSTTARFYAIVKPLYEDVREDSWAWAWTDVKVISPQLSRETMYKLSLKNLDLQCISSRDSTNPYVEKAVQYAVAAASLILNDPDKKDALRKLLLQGLDITILGSNDFYSYRNLIEARGLPLREEALASIPPFSSISFNIGSNGSAPGENCKPELAKTGLGSSAAMTTSLVAAILHYLGGVGLQVSNINSKEKNSNSDLELVHITAQTAHCLAQGKVGSGFDVSAAVYGSQRYVRFSPGVLTSAQIAVRGKPLQDIIGSILGEKWDHEKIQFSLPPLMKLMLGEPGTGGSSTPSMVGAVKHWQTCNPQKAIETFRQLSEENLSLELELKRLSHFAEEQWDAYRYTVESCSKYTCNKWMQQAVNSHQGAIVESFIGARNAFLRIRFLLQKMGQAAGVPIEPESQTRILDATMNMEGVLLAGIPGAGGFDAIFAITLGESGNLVAEAWSKLNVLPLLVQEDPRGVSLETIDPRTKEISSAISGISIF